MAFLVLGAPASGQAPARTEPALSRQLPPRRPAELGPPAAAKPAQPSAESGDRPAQPAPAGSPPPAAEAGEASCLASLAAIRGNNVEAADPKLAQGDPACRVSEPVVVKALALRASEKQQSVAFEPPVTVSCALAKVVADWVRDSVQPLVRGHFENDLTALRVGGGHECRRRNHASEGPVSEHATGRALDIFAFRVGDGKAAVQVVVEKPQGLVQNSFLTAIRQSACGAFTTALGPGSDAAHANHLHVDIQERRSRATHFCQ